MLRILPGGVVLIVLIGLSGCGGSGSAGLSGDVTLDDAPLEQGSILLTPIDATRGTTTGCEIKNGKYSLTGRQAPIPGNYRVAISATRKSGRKVQKALGKPGELDDELIEAVAARFNARSELTVEVKSGANGSANFAVRSK